MKLLLNGKLLLLCVFCLLLCCKHLSQSEREIKWLNSLKKGYSREKIEKNKPEFVKIHWDKPTDLAGGIKRYRISESREDPTEFIKIRYFIYLKDNKFQFYNGDN